MLWLEWALGNIPCEVNQVAHSRELALKALDCLCFTEWKSAVHGVAAILDQPIVVFIRESKPRITCCAFQNAYLLGYLMEKFDPHSSEESCWRLAAGVCLLGRLRHTTVPTARLEANRAAMCDLKLTVAPVTTTTVVVDSSRFVAPDNREGAMESAEYLTTKPWEKIWRFLISPRLYGITSSTDESPNITAAPQGRQLIRPTWWILFSTKGKAISNSKSGPTARKPGLIRE